MKPEDQVCSYKWGKKLKEFGVSQESLWEWWLSKRTKTPEVILTKAGIMLEDNWEKICSAFTVAELLQGLPEYIEHSNQPLVLVRDTDTHGLLCGYDEELVKLAASDSKDADALAKLKIHLVEKGLLKLPGTYDPNKDRDDPFATNNRQPQRGW